MLKARLREERGMTLSPRLPSGLACQVAGSGPNGAELSRMTELALRRGARGLAIGRGRSVATATAVTAFARRWEDSGGTVLCVVTWPEEAASWLRQATRYAAADPDLWIMAGSIQVSAREGSPTTCPRRPA
jgi:hypothetical protein